MSAGNLGWTQVTYSKRSKASCEVVCLPHPRPVPLASSHRHEPSCLIITNLYGRMVVGEIVPTDHNPWSLKHVQGWPNISGDEPWQIHPYGKDSRNHSQGARASCRRLHHLCNTMLMEPSWTTILWWTNASTWDPLPIGIESCRLK